MSELIDREATVKMICKMGEMVGGHDRDVVIAIALFVQDDKTAFPTVERPHGEWILDAVNPCSISWFRCSYCGYKYEAYKHSNFCPNCGADMREGEAE